jgi:hypothetical protein
MNEDKKSVSIRMPLALLDALHEIAKEDNRSLNGEVIAVLQRFVDDRRKKKAKA